MADTTKASSPAPQKRRAWLKILSWFFAGVLVLLIAVYFVATSSAFFKGVILPRVSKSLNAEITVSDASLSPFSQVVLHNLKVQTTGTEPLVTAPEVRARYNLRQILRGNIQVDELTLSSPTIILVENPDGTSNLDPITKSQKKAQPTTETKPAQPGKPSQPMQIDVRKIALTDATVRKVKLYAGSNRDVMELSKVNLALDDVKNGQTGKLTLSAELSLQNNPPAPGTNALLQAKANGSFAFALTPDLKPGSIKGNIHLEVSRAEGALAELATLSSDLDCELTPSELKQVALKFQKGTTPLGQVRVAGPFDAQKMEGKLSVEILAIDKQLLNVFGAKSGVDFGQTTVNSTNQIQLAKGGALITLGGQLDIARLQLVRTNQAMPQLDFRAGYDVTVDRSQSTALLRSLTFTGTQQGKALLRAELTSPMNLAWGNVTNALGDSALNLTVTQFNLADWQAFVGSMAPSGMVNAQLKLLSQQGGKQLTFDLNSQIQNLTAVFGTNQIKQADVSLQAQGTAADFKQFSLSQYKFELAQQNQPAITASGSGTYDAATTNADLQVTVQANLPRLGLLMPQPDMTLSSGTVELKSHVTQKNKAQSVSGTFALSDFSGKFATNELRGLGLTADFDVGMSAAQIQLRKVAGKLTQTGNEGASFELSGTYDPASTNADLQLALQADLVRLLQLAPQPDAKFSSGTVALKTHITQKQKSQNVTGSFTLAGLTGKFGKNDFQSFATSAEFDLGMNPQLVEARKFAGKLSENGKAGGSFDLSGTYDRTNKSAQLKAKLADFNQNGLRAFLEPALADKKLVSVALSADASVQYNPQGDSAVKGTLQITNLVVSDTAGQFPATPLAANLGMDASIHKQVIDVRQFSLGLTPTARAANQLTLSGQLDISQTNATKGNLKLAADSLDFTSYYDLFVGQKKTPAQPFARVSSAPPGSASRTQTSGTVNPEQEPPGASLPFTNFVAEVNVRRLYLHELEITNWQTTAKIDGGRVVLNPFKLALNGAPMSTTVDLDLAVRGYKYTIDFNAQNLPFAPLVNTFAPERKGQLGGSLSAQGKISGTGTTGASLQKNLAGQFDIGTTNLNLSVVNIKSALLKKLIDVVATIPELIKNPASAVGSLFSKSGGITDDLQKSPINVITARGNIAAGKVNLQSAVVESPAFRAEAAGTIALAEVLTNSTIQIPVTIALSQSIAQRVNLVAANTPTNAAYSKLPDFLTMTGTVGKPDEKINKLALGSLAAQGILGAIPGGGGKTGDIIRGLGGLLPGSAPAGTNAAPATNSPASAIGNLLNSFLKPKK